MEPSSTTFSTCHKLDRETTRARHHTKTCWSVVVTWQDKLLTLTTSRNTQESESSQWTGNALNRFFLSIEPHIGVELSGYNGCWMTHHGDVHLSLWERQHISGTQRFFWGPVYHPHSAWLHVSVNTISGRFWRVPNFDFLFKLLGKLIYDIQIDKLHEHWNVFFNQCVLG